MTPFALVPIHTFSSFSYLMDIVKDLGQLAILIYALGGVVYIVKNWTSFTSVVSLYSKTNKKVTKKIQLISAV